ncbi:hypothetical protein FA09DRAFT_282434, partial [Tilletiopsis washingtonensis]
VANQAVAKRAAEGQADIDTVILNYALTLEHLENAFYKQLPSAAAFKKAGYKSAVHKRFQQISAHEASHVKFLTTALGDKAVAACEYNFGDISKPATFVATSILLEGVGVSAYLGAAANITNPAYLTAAGSILTTESRHSTWVQNYAAQKDPFGAAYDAPLNFNQTYSLAAPLIKKCPDSNAALPVVAFPAASISPAAPKMGQQVTITSEKLSEAGSVGFITGGATAIVPINNGKVTLPSAVQGGRTYGVLLKGTPSAITDDSTVAGPFAFDIFYTPDQA